MQVGGQHSNTQYFNCTTINAGASEIAVNGTKFAGLILGCSTATRAARSISPCPPGRNRSPTASSPTPGTTTASSAPMPRTDGGDRLGCLRRRQWLHHGLQRLRDRQPWLDRRRQQRKTYRHAVRRYFGPLVQHAEPHRHRGGHDDRRGGPDADGRRPLEQFHGNQHAGAAIVGGTLEGFASGELIVNTAANLTIGSVIANNVSATALTKAGTATLILTGNNTYSGMTTIGAGTLQIGSGDAQRHAWALSGTVTNYGALVFDLSGASTLRRPDQRRREPGPDRLGPHDAHGQQHLHGRRRRSRPARCKSATAPAALRSAAPAACWTTAASPSTIADPVTFAPGHRRQRQPDAGRQRRSDPAGQQHLHAAARRSPAARCRSATARAASSWAVRASALANSAALRFQSRRRR